MIQRGDPIVVVMLPQMVGSLTILIPCPQLLTLLRLLGKARTIGQGGQYCQGKIYLVSVVFFYLFIDALNSLFKCTQHN